MKLSDDAFARLVAEDVKKRTSPEQQTFLRSSEHRDRWRRALEALLENLDKQLGDLQEAYEKDQERYKDFGAAGTAMLVQVEAETNDRRKKIDRFRFYVEQSLIEADRLIALGDDTGDQDSTIAFLQKAIETHKRMADEHEFSPNPIDLALWETLNGRWLFDEIE